MTEFCVTIYFHFASCGEDSDWRSESDLLIGRFYFLRNMHKQLGWQILADPLESKQDW
jgi:hypothetical protein